MTHANPWARLCLTALAFTAGMLAAAPVSADPGMPVPNPDADADAAYFAYLDQHGAGGADQRLERALGIGICNFLNNGTASVDEIKSHLSKDPDTAQAQLTGAAIFYCPWNLDRLAN